MKPVSPKHPPLSGFTLVEMLVSVTVLVLIMAFIAQMMNSATISTTLSGKHVDSDAEARLVFDRMSADFARMSHRTDVDFIFAKQPYYQQMETSGGLSGETSGTDCRMFFYSESPAYPAAVSGTDSSSVALIGYTVNTTGTSYTPAYSLQRLSKGLTLNTQINQSSGGSGNETSSMLFLTATGQGGLPLTPTGLLNSESAVIGVYPDPPSDVSDYDLLSPEVFRMDFAYEVKDLSNPIAPTTAYSNYPCAFFVKGATNIETINNYAPPQTAVFGAHPAVGDRWYDTNTNRAYRCTNLISNTTSTGGTQTIPIWTPNGMADVNAIVVTIAILDQRTRKLLPNDTILSTIASAFLAPTEAGLNPKLQSGGTSTQPQLTADLWQSELNTLLTQNTSASNAQIPASVLGQVRIYQRFFNLNNN
jgi:prepilin-type N-terminal cleavage/methylation domain-containing protein